MSRNRPRRRRTGRTRSIPVIIATLALALLFSSCSDGSPEPADQTGNERPPNFVIVFTDDQGYGDAGVYGVTDIRTPHLDRMAREGVRFTDFYVGGPVCTPSRAALLTGCYPKRVSREQGVLWPDSPNGLNPDENTIADTLKGRGYATACIGKWHLGRPASLLPTRQGFDTFFGIPYSNDMGPEHILSLLGADFPPLPLMRDEEVIEEGPDQDALTARLTEEAVRFIRENRASPFFLYLAHPMPHYPCHASEAFRDERVTPEHRGIYASAVEEVDGSLGRIFDTLEDLGLDERTLVIFASDNGPWELAQSIFREPTGSAGPLSGWKGTTREGGMRVPALMRWPGRLPAGAVCHRLATAMDLLPTLARYAGAELPGGEAHRIDGRDISGLMEQPDLPSPHEYLYYYDADTGLLSAVRDAAGWKLHLRIDEIPVWQLFDLNADIHEDVNLYFRHPEVVERLRVAAEAFDDEVTEHQRPEGWVDTGR